MKKLTYLCIFLLPVVAFAQTPQGELIQLQLNLQQDLTPLQQNLTRRIPRSKPATNVSQETLHKAKAVVTILKDGVSHATCDGLVLNHEGNVAVKANCFKDMNTEENPVAQIHVQLPNMGTFVTNEKYAFKPFFFTTQAIVSNDEKHNLKVFFLAEKLDPEVKAGIEKTFPVVDEETNTRLEIAPELAYQTLKKIQPVPTKTWGVCAVPPCDEPADQA